MADEADQADAESERHLSAALANARAAAKKREIDPNGVCHNCEALLPDLTMRFCDQDCRDDWAKRSAATRAARNLRADDDV